MNVWAFSSKVNPFGARLQPLFSSDIGHCAGAIGAGVSSTDTDGVLTALTASSGNSIIKGLRIRLVKRGTGASNRNADAMALVENLAPPADWKRESVDLSRFHQNFTIKAFAVTGPPRVIGDQNRATIGIDVTDADVAGSLQGQR